MCLCVCVCGLFLACEDFGERFDNSFPACNFFRNQFMHTNSTFVGQEQSTVAQQAEMTVVYCFLMSCV